jgi:copper chaperone CopZ
MKTKTFKVGGMHCRSCEILITDALIEAGAQKAEASHKKGEVKVTFDERKLKESRISDIISGEGFSMEVE